MQTKFHCGQDHGVIPALSTSPSCVDLTVVKPYD